MSIKTRKKYSHTHDHSHGYLLIIHAIETTSRPLAMAAFRSTQWPLHIFGRAYCIEAETITRPRKAVAAFQATHLVVSIFTITAIVFPLKG